LPKGYEENKGLAVCLKTEHYIKFLSGDLLTLCKVTSLRSSLYYGCRCYGSCI